MKNLSSESILSNCNPSDMRCRTSHSSSSILVASVLKRLTSSKSLLNVNTSVLMLGPPFPDFAKLWYIKLTPSLKKLAEEMRSILHNPSSFSRMAVSSRTMKSLNLSSLTSPCLRFSAPVSRILLSKSLNVNLKVSATTEAMVLPRRIVGMKNR